MPALYSTKIYAPNCYYHVFNRGVNRDLIFRDREDYKTFLSFLRTYLCEKTEEKLRSLPANSPQRYLPQSIDLIAYCLMPNHFHLVLKQKTRTAMTELLRVIGTNYAIYFNGKYNRVGTIFQGKYKAIIIDNEYYLLHLTRYVHLNPVELVKDGSSKELLKNYEFSSYLEYLGIRETSWIKPGVVASYFHSPNRLGLANVNSYQSFIEDYVCDPKETLTRLTID